MGKLLKWLTIAIAIIVGLLIVAGIIATQTIDTGTIKKLVEEQTKKNTGLDMQFQGDLSWSFFPNLKLGVSDIELHTEQSYAGDTLFARIGQAESAISLAQIVGGNLSIEQLGLERIELRMVTDKRGRSNWKDVEPQESSSSKKEQNTSPSADSSSAASIVFNNVNLKDINVDLIDQPSGTQQSLLVKSLKGDGINFAGKPFDISSTLEFASSESDKRFTLNFASPFRFDAAAQQFSIDELSGSLDQTQFSGYASILLGRDTEFSADLRLGELDLNQYMSASTSESSTETASDSGDADTTLPLDSLHTLNTALKLKITKVIYEKTVLDNVSVDVTIDNGKLDVKQLNAQAFGGQIKQSIFVDANRSPASVKANQQLENIDLTSLFASNDIELGLQGRATLQTSANARGNSTDALKRSLTGSTTVKLAEGKYTDDNIEHKICQSIALARQSQLTREWGPGTDLNDVDVNINWNNGIGRIQSLSAGLANATLLGEGQINLIDTSFDLRLLANVSGDIASAGVESTSQAQTNADSGCEINERYRSIQWPIRCKGNATENSCGVDNSKLDKILGDIAKSKAKEAVDKELDKQKEKLQEKISEKLGDEVGNALKGLFR